MFFSSLCRENFIFSGSLKQILYYITPELGIYRAEFVKLTVAMQKLMLDPNSALNSNVSNQNVFVFLYLGIGSVLLDFGLMSQGLGRCLAY